MHPTPGGKNAASAAILLKPAFSVAAGYYSDEFDLTVTAEEGTEIHYTTDGTTPTPNSPIYQKPIRVTDRSDEPNLRRSLQNIVYDWKDYEPETQPVKKAFLVRAVAIDSYGAMSEQTCASYFVGDRFDTDNAVISLTADDQAIFGEDGMYVTGKKNDAWYLGGGKGKRPTAIST